MILFDLDGTLIDSIKGIYESYRFSIREFDRKVLTPTEFREFIGASYDKMIIKIYPDLISRDKEHQLIVSKFRSSYDIIGYKQYEVFLNSLRLIKYIESKNISMGIVSNKKYDQVKDIVDKEFRGFNIENYGKKKGDWSKIQQCQSIMKRRNVKVFVGDTIEDYECAKVCNAKFIYANYGYGNVNVSKDFESCNNILEVEVEIAKVIEPADGKLFM